MLCILNRMAAAGRGLNRFYDSKRVLSFSIFNSQFSIKSPLYNALPVQDNIFLHSQEMADFPALSLYSFFCRIDRALADFYNDIKGSCQKGSAKEEKNEKGGYRMQRASQRN